MQMLRIGAGNGAMSVAQAHYLMGMIRQGDPNTVPELVQYPEAAPDQSDTRPGYLPMMEAALDAGEIAFAVVSLKEIPLYEHPRIGVVAVSARFDASNALVLPPGMTRLDTAKPIACSGLRRRAQLAALHPDWQIRAVEGDLATRLSWLDAGQLGALVAPVCQFQILGIQRAFNKRYGIHEVTPTIGEGVIAVLAHKGVNAAPLARFHDPVSWDMTSAESAFLQVFGGGRTAAAHAVVRGEKPDELVVQGMWIDPDGLIWRGRLRGRRKHALQLGAGLAQQLRIDREAARKGADRP